MSGTPPAPKPTGHRSCAANSRCGCVACQRRNNKRVYSGRNWTVALREAACGSVLEWPTDPTPTSISQQQVPPTRLLVHWRTPESGVGVQTSLDSLVEFELAGVVVHVHFGHFLEST